MAPVVKRLCLAVPENRKGFQKMTPEQFQKAIDSVGVDHLGAAAFLGVHKRTIRRWANDEREVPTPVAHFLRYLIATNKSGKHVMKVLGINGADHP
jgi:hypothetical protein